MICPLLEPDQPVLLNQMGNTTQGPTNNDTRGLPLRHQKPGRQETEQRLAIIEHRIGKQDIDLVE